MDDWQRQEWVDLMLDECETWAVVGLHDPRRTAYSIAELLQRRGKRIVPIHPLAEPVLGEPGYATLADVPFPVDVVDVFRTPRRPASSPTRPWPSGRAASGSSWVSSTRTPSAAPSPPARRW